jgi:hypothetical protein
MGGMKKTDYFGYKGVRNDAGVGRIASDIIGARNDGGGKGN